jgi:hypothetical protein
MRKALLKKGWRSEPSKTYIHDERQPARISCWLAAQHIRKSCVTVMIEISHEI